MDITKVKRYLHEFEGKKILVVGDLMLDHYLSGKVERISPEAPVPVVDVQREEYRLGGAANVVHNLKTLGALPTIVGIVGDDNYSETIRRLFENSGIDSTCLIVDPNRPTTLKTRVIAQSQQMLRVDREKTTDISSDVEEKVLAKLEQAIPRVDAVLIEDYNKGLLTQRVITTILEIARKHDKIVTVDPKFRHFFEYVGCTVFKPNFAELQKNLGIPIESEEQLHAAATGLLTRMQVKYLMITRGEKGLTVYRQGQAPLTIPTFAREVFDVSGAGDTVISTLTLALTVEDTIAEAAELANHAAGKVCGKAGIHPAYPDEILASFVEHHQL